MCELFLFPHSSNSKSRDQPFLSVVIFCTRGSVPAAFAHWGFLDPNPRKKLKGGDAPLRQQATKKFFAANHALARLQRRQANRAEPDFRSRHRERMSQRKQRPKNRPSHAAPLATPTGIHLTAFHPLRPLYAVATTAIGQNIVRIYDTDKATTGSQEPRTEIRLARGDEVNCLAWQQQHQQPAGTSESAKKRKRGTSSASSTVGELVCGLKSGRIIVIEQASGEIVRTLEGHSAGVNGWAPDEHGHEGWSCAEDGTIRAWDVRSGECSTYPSPPLAFSHAPFEN